MNHLNSITIRLAKPNDAETIAAFNRAMAQETENKDLIPEVILAGVRALFEHPTRGIYIVAETEGNVVACLMITPQWSGWRNWVFWVVQSVFVQADHRRRGIYRSMYGLVKELAEEEPGVCGFRLYVEQDNDRAQETYRALGMTQSPYRLFEELKSDV